MAGLSITPAGGSGTVTSVSVTSASGVSGSVATATTTPAITLALGAITPTSINGYPVNATPTASSIPVLDTNLDIWAGGWRALGAITYEASDAPTYTFSLASDMTAILSVGMRIMLTDSTVKYFIITAVGAFSAGKTIITVYGGTDYTLSGGAITSPFVSREKCPFGFPQSPAKWTVTATDTSDRQQLNPVSGTWYNLGSITISIPIGVWDVNYQVHISTNRASVGALLQYVTLSTANNSESDTGFSTRTYNDDAAGMSITLARSKLLTLASKTSYYLNAKDSIGSNTQINFLGSSIHPTIIKAVCAYL